jgi:outer membrane receptor for ferrienterochelin and colicin
MSGSVEITLPPRSSLQQTVEVRAVQRTRSVEDACCRVESIREEVQQHAPFAPGAVDVLRRYSSCTSTRTICAVDNASTIRLRGLEPTYIAVLVDGMPAMSGFGTMYGLGLIPSHALQTIRIAEGASSGLYGNGAISGVVDMQLRVPTEEPELLVSGSAVADGLALPGERDLNASWTGMLGDIGVAAFASLNNHRRADGLVPGAYDRYAALLKSNAMLASATELTGMFLAGHERREGELPGGRIERTDHSRTDLSLRLAHSLNEESEIIASALGSISGVELTAGEIGFEGAQQILYAGVLHNLAAGNHQLTFGGELRDDRLWSVHGSDVGYATTVASLLAQDELLLNDRWSLLGSLRLDRHSSAGTVVSPRGSIRFAPIANMTMRLMAGSGFKGQATFEEEGHRAIHGGYRWRPNESFAPERSLTLNYDISYRFALGANSAVDMNWTVYRTTIDGKAVADDDSLAAGTLFMVNRSGRTRLTGTELQVRPTLGDHWSAALGVSLIDYAVEEGGAWRAVPLAPSLNVDLSITFHDDESGLTAEVWGSHVGPQTLPASMMAEKSGAYTLVNLRAEKEFGPVALFAGLQNRLDFTQTTPAVLLDARGYDASVAWGPLEGRELFVGARLLLTGNL